MKTQYDGKPYMVVHGIPSKQLCISKRPFSWGIFPLQSCILWLFVYYDKFIEFRQPLSVPHGKSIYVWLERNVHYCYIMKSQICIVQQASFAKAEKNGALIQLHMIYFPFCSRYYTECGHFILSNNWNICGSPFMQHLDASFYSDIFSQCEMTMSKGLGGVACGSVLLKCNCKEYLLYSGLLCSLVGLLRKVHHIKTFWGWLFKRELGVRKCAY